MGQTIIKPKPDEDFYVIWSSVVDNAVGWGTKEEVSGMLFYDMVKEANQTIKAMAEKADRDVGRTNIYNSLIVENGPGEGGILSRKNLYAYVKYLESGETDKAAELVDSEKA